MQTIGEGNFDFVLGKSGGATRIGFVNLEGTGEQKILDNLDWENKYYRRDIGYQVIDK